MELLQIPLQLEFMLKMCLLQLLELVLLQVVETNATAMLGLVKMLLGNDDDDATAVVMQQHSGQMGHNNSLHFHWKISINHPGPDSDALVSLLFPT